MAGKNSTVKLCHDSRKLAIAIYDFLLEELTDNKKLSKKAKRSIDKAAGALGKVYKIKFRDCVLLKIQHRLREIYSVGQYPVPVKDRIEAEFHKRQGNSFMSYKLYQLAEQEYTEAVKLYPTNAIYYCNRAAARIGQNQFADAVRDCNKALELDRNYVKAYSWLGLAHALMENPGRAVRCYRKALRIEPGNRVCVENMDLINKKMNHSTFRMLEPLNTCRRGLARFFSNMSLFYRKLGGDANRKISEHKLSDLQIKKFKLGDLD